jgi:DNA-binding beta-propeller fold protein YncE
VCACALLTAACGDPLVVLGDAPGLMRIVLGVGDSLGTSVDSIAVRTRLFEPTGVAFDETTGTLYAADRGASRTVSGISTRVARVFSVTSSGRARLLLDGGGCTTGTCIFDPIAMVRAADGSLIIADAVGHRVVRYVPQTSITVLAGTGVAGDAPDGATATTSPLNRPMGVAIAPDGSIVFSEHNSNRVRAIGPDGRLRTVAGNGSAIRGGDGGAATAAGVVGPAGLTYVDGTLYIAEYGGAAIRAVDAAGRIATVAGTGVPGFAGDEGPASQAQLDRPLALKATADGRTLFVSEEGNHRVRAILLADGVIRSFAGTGDTRYAGSRRAAGETSLFRPAGVHAAGGFLFIADRGHAVVWRTSVTLN